PRVRVLRGRRERATYNASPVSIYRGNMLIEALPPIMSKAEVIARLALRPPYDPTERTLAPELRLHQVEVVRRFFVPLNVHVELEQQLSRSLRVGYLARNPADPSFWSGNEARVSALAA